jgi:AraC-like DNA-binding protein/quercetin dioxygenase-like cupin family protein
VLRAEFAFLVKSQAPSAKAGRVHRCTVYSNMRHFRDRADFQAFLPAGGRDLAHVWKFSWEYGGRRPLHFHAEPELNLVVSGSATFRVGDVLVAASRGDLLTFPPGQDHELLETSPDIYLFAIGMDPRLSAEVLRHNRQFTAMPAHLRLSSHDLASLVRRAAAIVDQDGVDRLAAELWEQVYWLRQRQAGHSVSPMHIFAKRAMTIIAEHPDWDGEQVARAARTRASELSRYFHRDLGITFVKYRARLRLLRFIRLMDEGSCNLMETALAAGFGSYSQCHRVFYNELGCFPRQFFQLGFREQMQSVYAP